MKFNLILFVILSSLKQCFPSKILVLFPTISLSHLIITETLTEELARRGHEIVVFSCFPNRKSLPNHRYYTVNMTNDYENRLEQFSQSVMIENRNPMSKLKNIREMLDLTFEAGTKTLENPELQKLITEETFDLVIINFFHNNFLLGIAEHLKCPTIMISAAHLTSSTSLLMRNPLSIETVPHNFMRNDHKMTLWNRLINFLLYSVDVIVNFYIDYQQKKIYDNHFLSNNNHPSYQEAKKNISLLLVNQYFGSNNNRPLVPSIVEVGGFHIQNSTNYLPEELRNWMEGAEHGIIYFSLGSNAKSKYLPESTLKSIMRSFSKLKQRVIFKWESDNLFPEKPKNVFRGKWLPQNDILAHPNLKVFISHCGLASVTEAKYYGVPIIGIPIFGDQLQNSKQVVNEGWGLELEWQSLNDHSVLEAVREILLNSKFSKNAKILSDHYKDRPLPPLDTAVFWTEYVIRQRGAKRLQSPAIHLSFIEFNMWDVFGVIVLFVYLINKVIASLLTKCAN